MTTRINLNGDIQQEAFISVLDHGFLFGDSVYEVISTHQGRLYFVQEHLKRLRNSARAISLEIPLADDAIIREIEKTVEAAANLESYIRIIVTRGVGEIDIDPESCTRPNVLIFVKPARLYPEENYTHGINVALVSVKRNPKESLNPGIKTGNYLNNVLAKVEARQAGAADALMLNPTGQLTECTTSNFFFVRDQRLMTPSLDCGILSGITREVVLRLARENGVLVEEGEWPPEILQDAEEAFITGTVKRVMPVTSLDSRPIGEGKPGPITKMMIRLYEDVLTSL
ncbi:MAG: aminotransferase class IV [Nitrospinae bacterium]|nr:aminotransferase class IV [Nitrospinota bacterium]